MSIEFSVDLSRIAPQTDVARSSATEQPQAKPGFGQVVQRSLEHVNGLQDEADASITELLTGQQQDINSVVASVARADMSFKLLVGVRNKLIEAYKETMKMQG